MKIQLLAILLIASIIFSFCGCKGNSDLSSSLNTAMSDIPEPSSEVSTSFIASTQSVENLISDNLSSGSHVSNNVYTSESEGLSIHFALSNNTKIMVSGKSQSFNTLFRPRDNHEAVSTTWSYKISDESVVRFAYNENTNKQDCSVWGCTLEALKPGTATITGTWYYKGKSCSDSFTVEVVKPEDLERSLSFSDGQGLLQEISSGSSCFIGINYSYGFFSIKDEEYKTEFKSSDETIAQISYKEKTVSERESGSDGVRVYGINPGDAYVTVTVYVGDKSFTDTCYIRVKEALNNPSGLASSFASSS